MPMIVNGQPCETKYTLRLYVSADASEIIASCERAQFTMSTGEQLVTQIHTIERGKWEPGETWADVWYEPVHDLGDGPLVITWESSGPTIINCDGKPWLDMNRVPMLTLSNG